MADTTGDLSIGELAARSGVAASALRFYESKGLLESLRSPGNHRVYPRTALRRVSVIVAAQRVGMTLAEIAEILDRLPRRVTSSDWSRVAAEWRPALDERIEALTLLRDRLDQCIGCGCLTLGVCPLQNPDDRASARGVGPRYLLGDPASEDPIHSPTA